MTIPHMNFACQLVVLALTGGHKAGDVFDITHIGRGWYATAPTFLVNVDVIIGTI